MSTDPTERPTTRVRGIMAPNPPGADIPEWFRSVFIGEDEALYVPAALVGPEPVVAMIASLDGSTVYQHAGHPYLKLDWVAESFPAKAELCQTIRDQVRECLAEDAGDVPADGQVPEAPQPEG